MTRDQISWRSRFLRHYLPDLDVPLSLEEGLKLRVSMRKHLGFLRRSTRMREFHLAKQVARLKKGSAVIYDVGANVGLYTLAFASGQGNHVHSFEPSPVALGYLRANVRLNRLSNVQVHPYVVSDSTGTRNFVLDEVTTAQSHVTELRAAGAPVQCIDLDSFAQARSLPAPDVVKIDVEGHDLSVVRGMRRLLSGGPVLYVEGGKRSGEGDLLSLEFLREIGYSAWNLERTQQLTPKTAEYAFVAQPRA